ncbi:Chemotaxis protein CheW [Planctomycetes bacterium Pan216]|uniref:Chemotaxis protein CheW n=1 Tax=Kolteria novifilia TaxID=2527975 RepID=A0A518B4C9_9BACT|nr:Chemotaxis protein CheW [Planctomycetes bacterium Pan216]
MLALLFSIGDDRFALDTISVIEVAPMVDLTPIADAPAHVIGLFRYRERILPVIDFGTLLRDRPSHRRLSTRIIVMTTQGGHEPTRRCGIVAERVTDTLHYDAADLRDVGMRLDNAPFLDALLPTPEGMIRFVNGERLVAGLVANELITGAMEHEAWDSHSSSTD